MGEGCQKAQTWSYKEITCEYKLHIMTVVNDTVLHIYLKSFHHKKKTFATYVW